MPWNFRFRQRSRLEEAGIPSTTYALSNTPTMVGTVDIEIAGYGYGLSFLFPLSFTIATVCDSPTSVLLVALPFYADHLRQQVFHRKLTL